MKELLKVCNEVLEEVSNVICEKEKELREGNNDKNMKSVRSVVCGLRKNYDILFLMIRIIEGEEISERDINLVKRMGYNKKKELREVSKEEVIKEDLIDKVVIKKVNGVNKYFIEC